MKISGIQTKQERVVVDVTSEELLLHVKALLHNKYPKFTSNYIDEKRNLWQMYSYTDGHNGDDHYKDGEVPTKEELFVNNNIKFIESLFKGVL